MEPSTWTQHPEHARRYDVCNGDADGLCAVRQWRLHEPAPATLITGLKREIDLLARVPIEAAGEVLVCDLSMQRNRAALERLLAAGVRVRWFDHHAFGTEVPLHAGFDAHLDTSPRACTSLLMDHELQGRFRAWALVAAYGDNLTMVADTLATQSGFGADERRRLRRLGEAINYNAYGESLADVCLAPAQMYVLMSRYEEPLALLAREPVFETIERQREADLQQARAVLPYREADPARVCLLPDAPWSRRISGTLANALANAKPAQAQAVLKRRAEGGFTVSVRAPLQQPQGASELCARFGGSGRTTAAGIDHLPEGELERFVDAFVAAWPARHP